MTDTRPEQCRFRLLEEGKPYPKSSCTACGRGIMTGLERACAEIAGASPQVLNIMPMSDHCALHGCAHSAQGYPTWPVGWAFREGDPVRKKNGSWWEGKIVGWYSTRDTPRGYAIQAQVPGGNGPVQIFPETAIIAHPTPEASDV